MADALSTLLNLQSPANRSVGGPNVQIPGAPDIRRNNAKTSLLAKFLGVPDDGSISEEQMESTYNEVAAQQAAAEQRKAELDVLPEQVRGQYGLQTERMRGQSTVEAARLAAERAATERETAREFQAGQNELGRQVTREGQQATTNRTQMTQQGIAGRQQRGQTESRARLFETKDAKGNFKMNAPRPQGEGWWGRLTGPSQESLNSAEANRLRSGALQQEQSAPADVSEVVQSYLQMYPGVQGQELLSILTQEQPTASPEEIQGLAQQIEAAQAGAR